jgi:hypothetical protein
MGKKVSINVERIDDGTYSIEFSQGLLSKKHASAETVDSLVQKTSGFLRSEFAGPKKKGDSTA